MKHEPVVDTSRKWARWMLPLMLCVIGFFGYELYIGWPDFAFVSALHGAAA